MASAPKVKRSSQSTPNGTAPLKARSVSRGVAVGTVVCLHGKKRQYYRVNLKESQLDKEVRRFRAAVRLAKRQLRKLAASETDALAGIFDAHHLILEDSSFLTKIESVIREKTVNAEWAVKYVAERYIALYKDIPDEHLRERHIDIRDISERLLTVLGKNERVKIHLHKNSIIAATELNPSTLVELSKDHVAGIITERGGWTSHTFILARELGLPAVTGVKGLLRRVKTGDQIVIDGYSGTVYPHPDSALIKQYQRKEKALRGSDDSDLPVQKGELKTLDGTRITIRANLDIASAYDLGKRSGAEGIGLFRSEFLFNQNKGYPTETEQYRVYSKIGDLAGKHGAKIRTFDLCIDQLNQKSDEQEKNPALGLRAIRLSLTHEKNFRIQLRALLRASEGRNLDIVLPMISDVTEILTAKKIIREETARLKKHGSSVGAPSLGAMIEVPAAVEIADHILEEVDFACLGTNDLVQYTLGVDRDNELVSSWFRTLHPAVLSFVKKAIDAGDRAAKPIVVCGEMAGSPVYAPILIGMGAKELSMNVSAISKVRYILQHIAFEEAQDLVNRLFLCKTSDQVEAEVKAHATSKWKHLFSTDIFS